MAMLNNQRVYNLTQQLLEANETHHPIPINIALPSIIVPTIVSQFYPSHSLYTSLSSYCLKHPNKIIPIIPRISLEIPINVLVQSLFYGEIPHFFTLKNTQLAFIAERLQPAGPWIMSEFDLENWELTP